MWNWSLLWEKVKLSMGCPRCRKRILWVVGVTTVVLLLVLGSRAEAALYGLSCNSKADVVREFVVKRDAGQTFEKQSEAMGVRARKGEITHAEVMTAVAWLQTIYFRYSGQSPDEVVKSFMKFCRGYTGEVTPQALQVIHKGATFKSPPFEEMGEGLNIYIDGIYLVYTREPTDCGTVRQLNIRFMKTMSALVSDHVNQDGQPYSAVVQAFDRKTDELYFTMRLLVGAEKSGVVMMYHKCPQVPQVGENL